MRLALTALGWDLFTIEVTRGLIEIAEAEPGDALSTGFGFVAAYEQPDEADFQDR